MGSGGAETKSLVANDSWCPEGFEQSAAETCFALPEGGGAKDAAILVYLHGTFKEHGAAAEWEIARGATKRGFAVVVPRGKRAACEWRAELRDYYCWPHDPDDIPAMKSTVAEWDRVLWQVDALLEKGTHKRYVLGHGDGALFAEALATHGLFAAQAYGLVEGGSRALPTTQAKAVPLLLVTADDDKEQSAKSRELHDALTRAAWPHALCPRPGARALSADDLDVALRFFKREAEGALRGAALSCR